MLRNDEITNKVNMGLEKRRILRYSGLLFLLFCFTSEVRHNFLS